MCVFVNKVLILAHLFHYVIGGFKVPGEKTSPCCIVNSLYQVLCDHLTLHQVLGHILNLLSGTWQNILGLE